MSYSNLETGLYRSCFIYLCFTTGNNCWSLKVYCSRGGSLNSSKIALCVLWLVPNTRKGGGSLYHARGHYSVERDPKYSTGVFLTAVCSTSSTKIQSAPPPHWVLEMSTFLSIHFLFMKKRSCSTLSNNFKKKFLHFFCKIFHLRLFVQHSSVNVAGSTIKNFHSHCPFCLILVYCFFQFFYFLFSKLFYWPGRCR
jgi:hypothetical protein